MASLYPAGPASVPAGFTSPSKNYRRHAWLAMLGLLGFVLGYLGLLGWFAWTSYRLVAALLGGTGNGGDALLSLGAALCSAFLAFFMLKALVFNKRAKASSQDMELKPQDQPELFEFLHRLADEARAPRPHRVYLSANVNAGVFYDLSLANLIFPSKKNLEIGLGLVNVLNLGELKAVLAHEFGHFAQRTMAVGRWVYVAQQIASHIVAKRDALDGFLAALSRVDFRIAWIGWILSLVVWSIRSLVEIAFRTVVMAQRALSREMEYQADLVSASLTGSDALVHALHRLGAADAAWSRALQFANGEFHHKRPVKDLFAIQSRIIEHLRTVLADPGYGQSPSVPQDGNGGHRVFKTELVQPPQMWSTHPSSAAREHNIKQVYVSCAIDERPALCLLRDAQALKEQVSRRLMTAEAAEFAATEDSLRRLDEEYAARSFSPRYRGSYLGRSFVRRHASAGDLLGGGIAGELLPQLDALYAEAHGEDIEKLRELEQQRETLEAVRLGALQAEGGMLHWRGAQVSRKALPSIIAELERELEPVRQAVHAHDQRCRALHIAAAEKLGPGWVAALQGQLHVLHYAEHAQADISDANALLANTYGIVTADGRVSAAELRKLVAACNQVQSALHVVYDQARQVNVDATMAARLGVTTWPELLEHPFSLPRASEQNINAWMKAVDSWTSATLGALSALRHAALESLLATEDEVARQLRNGVREPEPAQAAAAPREYITLLPGKGRQLQHKLGWWDKFQTADGFFPGAARVAVAGGIVGAVLLLGGAVGLSKVNVFNGLARPVAVTIDGQSLSLQPFESGILSVPNQDVHKVETRTSDGALVESFDGDAPPGAPHLVYNIAAAAPLIEWTASYGSAPEVPERRLGAQRWIETGAEYVFVEPPKSIQSKTGNDTRSALSGFSNASPSQMLGALQASATKDAAAVVAAHARWDAEDSRYLGEWLWRAQEQDPSGKIVAERLRRNPREIVSLRMEQEYAKGPAHEAVCARHRALAAKSPEVAALHYIAARCIADPRQKDDAFVAGHLRWPQERWLTMAAGYVYSERGQWDKALPLMEQLSLMPEFAEGVAPDLARLKRSMAQASGDQLAALADRSSYLANMLALETGKGTDGTPFAAYRYLSEGDLPGALGMAATDDELSQRVLRLAAASDGATADMVDRMLALPSGSGMDGMTAWTSLAVATREHRNATALREAALASDPDDAAAIATFFDAVHGGADQATAEAALGSVSLRSRGIAYATAVILRGQQCPAAWRDSAKKLLFSPERPYFS